MGVFSFRPLTREFLENVIDAVRGPVVVLDGRLRVVAASRAFYDTFRVGALQTLGRRIYDLGNGQWNIPALRDLLETILPHQTSFHDFQVVHEFTGLGLRTMLLNARQIKRALGGRRILLLAIEDVTVRRAAEAAADRARQDLVLVRIAEEQAKDFAQGIIDTIREPLLALDQDLRVLAASRAFYEVFQTQPSLTIGQRIYDLGDQVWDIPKLRQLLETILTQATTFNDYEVVHDFPVVGRKVLLLNARQVKRRLGSAQVILLALEDVTDRRHLEEELERIQRVESLGVLAGGIAHDFNNLMAGLLSNSELIRVHLETGQTALALERLSKTPAIFERGRGLTRRLLTFSKGGAPVRTPTNLGPRLAEWLEFSLLGSDVTGTLDVADDLWACECDLAQIGQVVNNLLLNARQASPDGGVVTVQASNLNRLGPVLALRIGNIGPPIPVEVLRKIFDPFFTTKSSGSGLGLAVAHSIVRQHGGSIEVESREGSETAFTVFLPALTEALPLAPPPVRASHGVLSGTVLVMDDDPAIREAVGEMVRTLGFEALRAGSGEEVLVLWDHLVTTGTPVDVFLLDGNVPGGMGGLATARVLRSRGFEARIVIMSGNFDSEVSAAPVDGLGKLAKPFSLAQLRQALGSEG